jgi:hypothetical protein
MPWAGNSEALDQASHMNAAPDAKVGDRLRVEERALECFIPGQLERRSSHPAQTHWAAAMTVMAMYEGSVAS